MIQENIDSIRLLDYPDERVRARLLDNQLVPIVEHCQTGPAGNAQGAGAADPVHRLRS